MYIKPQKFALSASKFNFQKNPNITSFQYAKREQVPSTGEKTDISKRKENV